MATPDEIRYLSLDITGLSDEAKQFLMERLEHVHEYSWLVNLDGSDNPLGEHYISIRGTKTHINAVGSEYVRKFDCWPPEAMQIHPDTIDKWKGNSVRERMDVKYAKE